MFSLLNFLNLIFFSFDSGNMLAIGILDCSYSLFHMYYLELWL